MHRIRELGILAHRPTWNRRTFPVLRNSGETWHKQELYIDDLNNTRLAEEVLSLHSFRPESDLLPFSAQIEDITGQFGGC